MVGPENPGGDGGADCGEDEVGSLGTSTAPGHREGRSAETRENMHCQFSDFVVRLANFNGL